MNGNAVSDILVEVDNTEHLLRPARPLLDELLRIGIAVSTSCGGQGVCHLCRIWVDEAAGASGPTSTEERALGNTLIAQGMRLSCQIRSKEGMRIRTVKIEPSSVQ